MSITYLRHHDTPARITRREDGTLYAERYLAGHGFVPGDLMDLLFDSYAISVKEFEQMVLNLRAGR